MIVTKKLFSYFSAILLLLGVSIGNTNAQTTPDPGIPGTLAVTKVEYNLGDLAVVLDSFPNPVEVRASVHYPTSLPGAKLPVIVLLHGRHSTCYRTTAPFNSTLAWPCATGFASIESFQGYDYHARFMASHGYIVVSISCNAINAADNSLTTRGMPARGQIIQHHLNLINTYNTGATSPLTTYLGSTLVGKFDLQHIGTMGHSRGGEGVVFHALLNQSLGSPYGVKGVITLAPVDFRRKILNDIPLMNIAPYCDGDVSNIQGVHFYDDARYNVVTDESPKHNVLMMGANHNFYNTVWTPGSYIAGTSDDWNSIYGSSVAHCGTASSTSGRFDTATQQAAYNSYASAFFRMYVGGEDIFAPILETKDIIPPVSSLLDTSNVYVSYHPGRTDRIDINRIDTVINTTINTMGDTVTQSGLLSSGICGGGDPFPACAVSSSNNKEPHKGIGTTKGLAQMGMRWNDTTDWYQNDIPAAKQNLTYVEAVQFRAALRFNECTPGLNLDFTVQLIDSVGDTSSQTVHNNSYALYYPPGTHGTQLPKVMFNSIRLPIDSFLGIDRTKVRQVRFLFNKSAAGSILISDLAFVNSKCGMVDATYGFTTDTAMRRVSFLDTLSANTGDTVAWLWNFGDPTSGTADTSTLHNPTHIYSDTGSFTACLYVFAKRLNERICTDTFCTTFYFAPTTSVSNLIQTTNIKLIPNPASNYVQVSGAAPTDVIRLINQLGQVVLSTTLSSPTVYLPPHLANGIYYAIIATANGNVHQKLVISR